MSLQPDDVHRRHCTVYGASPPLHCVEAVSVSPTSGVPEMTGFANVKGPAAVADIAAIVKAAAASIPTAAIRLIDPMRPGRATRVIPPSQAHSGASPAAFNSPDVQSLE